MYIIFAWGFPGDNTRGQGYNLSNELQNTNLNLLFLELKRYSKIYQLKENCITFDD